MEDAANALGDAANSLAAVLAAVPKKPRVKKPKKPVEVAPVPVAEPVAVAAAAPVQTVEASLNDRLLAILQSGGVLDEEDEEPEEFEEPLSPGAERHKSILESQGRSWADYYDDEVLEEELIN